MTGDSIGRLCSKYIPYEDCINGNHEDCEECALNYINSLPLNKLIDVINKYKEVCITISDGRITDFNII